MKGFFESILKALHVRTVTINKIKKSAPLVGAVLALVLIGFAVYFKHTGASLNVESSKADEGKTSQKITVTSYGGSKAGSVDDLENDESLNVCVIPSEGAGGTVAYIAVDSHSEPISSSAVMYYKKAPTLKGYSVGTIHSEVLPEGTELFALYGDLKKFSIDDVSIATFGVGGYQKFVYTNTKLSKMSASSEIKSVLDEYELQYADASEDTNTEKTKLKLPKKSDKQEVAKEVEEDLPENIEEGKNSEKEEPQEVEKEQVKEEPAKVGESDAPDALEEAEDEDEVPVTENDLVVHVIDVGQGSSTLLVCEGHAALIDAGTPASGTAVRAYLGKVGVKSLDYLILTHPDADHIGGAASVISNIEIGRIFSNGVDGDSKTYNAVENEISYKSLKEEVPEFAKKYELGSASFMFYGPVGGPIEGDDNNSSLVLKATAKKGASVLVMGDAEDLEEALVLDKYKKKINSDLLVVGHHGSKSSSTQDFVNAVSPSLAAISVGADNTYGHPSDVVVDRLESANARVFRTDEVGDITFTLNKKAFVNK